MLFPCFVKSCNFLTWCLRLFLTHSPLFWMNNKAINEFGFRRIVQLARDFLKACPVYQDILPFLPFPFHYALSAPTAHVNRYRLILLIWHQARSGHCLWPTTGANIPLVLYSARCMLGVTSVQFSLHQGRKVNLQHFLSRTLFGTLYVRGRERTVFFTSG